MKSGHTGMTAKLGLCVRCVEFATTDPVVPLSAKGTLLARSGTTRANGLAFALDCYLPGLLSSRLRRLFEE